MKIYRAYCVLEYGVWRATFEEAKADLENIIGLMSECEVEFGTKAYIESVTISEKYFGNELGDDAKETVIAEFLFNEKLTEKNREEFNRSGYRTRRKFGRWVEKERDLYGRQQKTKP